MLLKKLKTGKLSKSFYFLETGITQKLLWVQITSNNCQSKQYILIEKCYVTIIFFNGQ